MFQIGSHHKHILSLYITRLISQNVQEKNMYSKMCRLEKFLMIKDGLIEKIAKCNSLQPHSESDCSLHWP